MENKYYTPTIEEFHVGFEYEVLAKAEEGHNGMLTTFPIQEKDEWFKFKFPDPYVGYMLPKLFQHHTIRVKYLDKEDIESLGFTVEVLQLGQDTNYDELDISRKGGASIGTFYPNKHIHGANIELLNTFYNIKNKSEFKRILQQIGILDAKG